MNFWTFFVALLVHIAGGALQAHSSDESFLKPKILHLSFHKGCIKEFQAVADELSLTVESWFIPDLPAKFLDGTSTGNVLYNIGHLRAQNIWHQHKEYFEQFDVIMTSDTAPLARIFLQNNWHKPLIIWICNRFDYCDTATLDCDFPDAEYYQLFEAAHKMPNVKIIAYTEFEHHYAKSKGIDTGNLTITPCAPKISASSVSAIPETIIKQESFFLPPYHNENIFMPLADVCRHLGINTYVGRYNGPMDLKDFKGIIHLPYSWSNLALFENMNLGIPYFIPSISFFKQLAKSGNYFHPNLSCLLNDNLYYVSEWYSPSHAAIFTYFDSWEHLQQLVSTLDYGSMRKKIKAHAAKHRANMLTRWKAVFDDL